MSKVTDRILWTVLILALGVSVFVIGKSAFTNIIHGSTQHLSHLTKQWEGATPDDDMVDASSKSDFSYSNPNTTDHTISIVGYSGHEENLIIPQYRKIGLVSYKVTAIGRFAFYKNQSIERVTIPDGLRTIEDDAFRHEYNLKHVTLGSGVTSIGGWAFQNTSLVSVDLPAGVTSIGDWAFQNTSITSINLPAGVTSIGAGTFWGTKLTSIDFPASITSIGDRAFQNAPISSISFKHRVDLGELSFTGTKLTNVTLPTGSTYHTDANNQTFDANVKVTVE